MELRAALFIGSLFIYRFFTLFGLHILHQHRPRAENLTSFAVLSGEDSFC